MLQLNAKVSVSHYFIHLFFQCSVDCSRGKKTHKFLTKVTQGLGSTTSSCQTSARFRALTLHKHLQSLVKKKKRFLTFLKNKPLAFLDTVALKITDFLVCCCCVFFFYYSNTKYFLHYQFSHFKASIVKQHTLQEPLTLPYKHLQMNTFKPASTSVTTAIKEKCKQSTTVSSCFNQCLFSNNIRHLKNSLLWLTRRYMALFQRQ